MATPLIAEIEELRQRAAELKDLYRTIGLLGWDQETMMPPGGVRWRASQMATLEGIYHERLTAPRLGELIDRIGEAASDPASGVSEVDRALVRELRRERDRAVKLPGELVMALARATTEGVESWRRARAESNWAGFVGDLERIVALKREVAERIGYTGSPYDALLDDYEPGMTVEQLTPLFAQLRQDTVALLGRIQESHARPSRKLLEQEFDVSRQQQLARKLLEMIGFDFKAGRLDTSTHPFAQSLAPTDVRVTNRYDERDLGEAIFGAIHEGGHALYEQGIDPALATTLLGRGASLGVHESQSRLWENFVGRGLPFWEFFLPQLAELFPEQLRGCTPIDVARAVNVVQPSFIRTEADEVTYNLHVILRFEIERALFAGEVAVAELPAVWNEKMRDLLGVVPPNDRLGVLQDTHWASGLIGYFPTYTLGNLIAAQLWQTIRKEFSDWAERIRGGDLGFLLGWLRDRLHRHGKVYLPGELIERVTGEPLNPRYLTAYLNEKFGAIYE